MNSKYYKLKTEFNQAKINRDTANTRRCIENALKIIKEQTISKKEQVSLYYSIATAYFDLVRFQDIESDTDNLTTNSLYYFAMAINELDHLKPYQDDLFQRIYTNAAMIHNYNGRIIKALQLFDETSYEENGFPMAMAHKCAVLEKYALLYNVEEQSEILIKVGYENLCAALIGEEAFIREGALDAFKGYKYQLENTYSEHILNRKIRFEDIALGKRKSDIEYRKWTTAMGLNLNVLNDVMLNGLSAFDNIHLPRMRYLSGDDNSKLHYGLFNQIIQEYVSARYLFYHGQKGGKSVSIADANVLQMDMYDTVESYYDFCIRTAFKTIYSLFDKIAFFINEYWKLNLDVDKLSYKTLTNSANFHNKTSDNEMLKAIYWTSKEFYDIDNTATTNPNAKRINKLRNYMEHRYLAATLNDEYKDTKYIKHINTSELYNITCEIFKLCRETIIYLVLAIGIGEKQKSKEGESKGIHYVEKIFYPIKDIQKY